MKGHRGEYDKGKGMKKEFRLNLRVNQDFLDNIAFVLKWDKEFRRYNPAKNISDVVDYAVSKMRSEMEKKLNS